MENIDELINALENLQEAKSIYNEAAKNYQYDRGYFLQSETDAIDKAKNEFSEILTSVITNILINVINSENK